ncbi:neuropeptide SIFamide receptor-like [Exaiptasia diaphana]|uniref:G-protein coupled receptors family 1 profile domain-containing protein n=1 Tax=Exaiptasia diaphana TaxID=2652724 RepID=A0A913YQY2_EXADI|nr:neuropeptide SIFamide receptor-like [Exaiptasia diaphana]
MELNLTSAANESLLFSNTSSSSPLCFVNERLVKRIPRVLAYLIIIIVSLLGNTMTVMVVKKGPTRRNCAHVFLANMSLADLVITVVYMPRMVIRMFYGSRWLLDGMAGLVSCRGVLFLHHTAILVAVFSIFLITLDRFCAMMFPLKRIMTKRSALGAICLSWILAGVLRLPFLMSSEVIPSKNYKLVCSPRFSQFFGEIVSVYRNGLGGVFWFFLALTIVLYIVIISHLFLKKSPGNTKGATNIRQRAGRKLLKMLLCITSSYLVCWFLYFLGIPLFGTNDLPCEVIFIRFFLAHLNCALNPCLLACFDLTYRKGYRNILKGLCCSFQTHLESSLDVSVIAERREDPNGCPNGYTNDSIA